MMGRVRVRGGRWAQEHDREGKEAALEGPAGGKDAPRAAPPSSTDSERRAQRGCSPSLSVLLGLPGLPPQGVTSGQAGIGPLYPSQRKYPSAL